MGDLPLDAVSRTKGIELRDKLQAWAIEKGKTATTADNILASLRALFNVARDKGWLTGNPLERMHVEIGGKESEGREPWTKEELGLIFSDPLLWCLKSNHQIMVLAARATDAKMVSALLCHTNGLGSSL